MAPKKQVLLLVFAMGCPPYANGAFAQKVDSIPVGAACKECSLEPCGRISIGEEGGPGYVDWPSASARSSRYYFVVNRSTPNEISVFNNEGVFLQVLGRAGEGPGEYREIWDLHVASGDTLHVIDILNLRRTILSPDLTPVRTTRLLGRPQKQGFLSLPDGGFLLNAPYPNSDGEIRVLHRMDSDGRRMTSFAGFDDEPNRATASLEFIWRVPALAADGSVFTNGVDGFSVEQWSLEGEKQRVMIPTERGWEKERAGGIRGAGARIMDLRVDDSGLLWVLTRITDPNWEEAVEVQAPTFPGGHSEVDILDYHGYWDSVLEVWDPAQGILWATQRFPEYFLSFLESGELVSFRMSPNEGAWIDFSSICISRSQ